MADTKVFRGAQLATFASAGAPYGLVENGAIAVSAGVIRWVGPKAELPVQFDTAEVEDLGGRW